MHPQAFQVPKGLNLFKREKKHCLFPAKVKEKLQDKYECNPMSISMRK